MAWTWSAPERGTVAVTTLALAGQQPLLNQLFLIGKGDLSRGLCIVFAGFLTLAGACAPHVPPLALAAFLFLSGASLALIAAAHMRDGASFRFSDVKGVEDAPLRTVNSSLLFTELLTPASTSTAIDRAAWTRLTAQMSHELRTPLNAVLGFSELMANEVFGPIGSSQYAGYARDIHASGRQLLKTAEDALAITALLTAPDRKGALPVAHIASALDDALAFHASAAPVHAITVEIAATADVYADAQTVRQILINLISDATSRAMPGTSIALSAQSTADRVALSITVAEPRTGEMLESGHFPLVLAKTLSELSGAQLLCGEVANGAWRTSVSFIAASQCDFFALTARHHS